MLQHFNRVSSAQLCEMLLSWSVLESVGYPVGEKASDTPFSIMPWYRIKVFICPNQKLIRIHDRPTDILYLIRHLCLPSRVAFSKCGLCLLDP